MLNIGPPELILIFVIALVIVGPQRLPELARTVGRGLNEFRKMQNEVKDLVNTGMGDEFKDTAAELKRTASDLKSATDVRSAFRGEDSRARPHGPRARSPAGPSTPAPDVQGANAEPASTSDDGTLGPPAGQDGPSAPPTASSVDNGESGADE